MIRPISINNPLAGHHTLNVAPAVAGGIRSLASLPLAPRLGEAPRGYHPFSAERIERGRRHFLTRGRELGQTEKAANKLFEKFLGAFRCIDPITYQQALIQMGMAVRHFVGEEPYTLLKKRSVFGSQWYVYEELRAMGLIPEARRVIHWDLLNEMLEMNEKVVALDDCSYTGSAILVGALLEYARQGEMNGWQPSNLFVGLVASSERAWETFYDPLATYYVGLRIENPRKAFTSEEVDLIRSLFLNRDGTGIEKDLITLKDDTFSWFKVPDGFVTFLGAALLFPDDRAEIDANGDIVLPSPSPFYFEMRNPNLFEGIPIGIKSELRKAYQQLLSFGPKAVFSLRDQIREFAPDVKSLSVDASDLKGANGEMAILLDLKDGKSIVLIYRDDGTFIKSIGTPKAPDEIELGGDMYGAIDETFRWDE